MHYTIPRQDSNSSAGSLASMIDIIFLLIIFFVVTASYDREQIDASVELPSVDAGIAVKNLPSERLVLNVTESGNVKIGYREIPPGKVSAELGSTLTELNSNRKTMVVINGAAKVRHKYIASVLEAAASAGFDQVRINAVITDKE